MKSISLSSAAVAFLLLAGMFAYLSPSGGFGLVHPALASSNDGGDSGQNAIEVESGAYTNCDGSGLGFWLKVCNIGSDALQDVVITDTLPPGMIFSDGSITGTDSNGNSIGVGLCNDGTASPGDECPCEGGVTLLVLEYTGPDATLAFQGDDGITVPAVLSDGNILTLNGSRSDGRFQKNNLIFTVTDSVTGVSEDTVIHVSCSKPIGVGFQFGPFTVLAMASRNGGMFDAVCVPPPPACPCDGGVTSLTLVFNGEDGTQVTVEDDGQIIFPVGSDPATLSPGYEFTLTGSRADGRFQKNNLVFTVTPPSTQVSEDTVIHVSCSQPIGIDSVFGPFTVVAFSSRNGGLFDAPCTGAEAQGGKSKQDRCKGQKLEICLDGTIPPGECVTINFDAVFTDVLCNLVKVEGHLVGSGSSGGKSKAKGSILMCLDNVLGDCVCTEAASTGACCLSDGTCVDDTQADACAAMGGAYQGDASTCGLVTCPPPTGACCLLDSSTCVDNVQADECSALNGSYLGDVTSCGFSTFPAPPTGACLGGDVCMEVPAWECCQIAGTYNGDGTTCPTP